MNIETNIPLPKIRPSRWSKMAAMKKGESFIVTHGKVGSVFNFARRHAINIETHRIDDFSTRVWRK